MDERIKKIADHYGFTSQANMLCEESAEYMVALNKLRRGKPEAYANVKEEVADIIVVAKQLRYLLGADEIDKIISEKLDRQIQRIEAEREDVPNVLRNIPSADVQEKRYCRMIPLEPDCRGYTDTFFCTNCKLHIHLGFIGQRYGGNYCLECGAEVKDGDTSE